VSTVCITPTYTDIEASYEIFSSDPPPCIPDAVTELKELLTELLEDLTTEDSAQLLLEGSD